jgi:hypothetical protein
MLKHNLANQLRQRQYRYGQVDRKIIDSLSDDQIIDCYITCSCCGEKQVDENILPIAINQASDSDHFFAICDIIGKLNNRGN